VTIDFAMYLTLSRHVIKFLVKNNHYVDHEELKLELPNYTLYPSLHWTTDVLEHFAIGHLFVQVSKSKETLLPLPLKIYVKERIALIDLKLL